MHLIITDISQQICLKYFYTCYKQYTLIQMKLTLKTLKGEVFHVEAEPQSTIADVKVKIQQQKGLEVDSQKIVYRGKPAVDTDTVVGLGIKEGDFLVIMNLLKKPEAKPKQPPKKQETKQQQKPVAPTQPKKESQAPTTSTTNEAQITELMSMGFDREKCVAALNAAFGVSDVAADYLINGIPADVQGPGAGNVEELLRALINTPEFQPLKEVLRDDPTSVNAVLEQIRTVSPPLYNLIAQNPDLFQKVLTEQIAQQQALQGQQGDDIQGQQQGQQIHITHQQDAAIKRLMALGFNKIDAAQAYFACDKNQEMAANLLFDRQANGDMDQGGHGGQGGQGDGDDDDLFN